MMGLPLMTTNEQCSWSADLRPKWRSSGRHFFQSTRFLDELGCLRTSSKTWRSITTGITETPRINMESEKIPKDD